MNMPPKYIGLFSKLDKNGKLQWKVVPSDEKSEISIAVEIMRKSGYDAEYGFEFNYAYNGYLRMN